MKKNEAILALEGAERPVSPLDEVTGVIVPFRVAENERRAAR